MAVLVAGVIALALRSLRSRVCLVALGVSGLSLFPASAHATSSQQFQWRLGPAGSATAEIRSGQRVLLRLSAEPPTAVEQEAAALVDRLEALALASATGADFNLKAEGPGFVLMARGQPLVSITKERAYRAQNTPSALAKTWLQNLQAAFRSPYLAVPETRLVVPLGETRGVRVAGSPPGPLVALPEAGPVCQVTVADEGQAVTLFGLAVGQQAVRLRRGSAELLLQVEVKKYAGRCPDELLAQVTGQRPPSDFLQAAIWNAVLVAATWEPGAQLILGEPRGLSATFSWPSQATVEMPLQIRGEDYLPVEKMLAVSVRTVPWSEREAERLIVSNDPENVAGTGLLGHGYLVPNQLARLLYHHKNIAPLDLTLEVRLENPSDEPAQVHVRNQVFGPARDEIYVGHCATVAFWHDKLAQRGYLLRLPPHRAWRLASRRVSRQGVLSGLAELTLLSGRDVRVKVIATQAPPSTWPLLPLSSSPEEPARYTWLNPYRQRTETYRVGGPHTFISIGRDPLKSLAGKALPGNYGVLYDVALTLHNPTPEVAPTEIRFSADGGVARGVVLINGEVVETGLVPAAAEERLCKLRLRPAERRSVRLQIMPQAGSNYPLRLVARPAG